MRILVLSDTHIPLTDKVLPAAVVKELKNCSLCLHAGDFIEYSVFETLSSYIPTIGVCGNMDRPCIRKKLPEKKIVEVENVRIGITHGRGAPDTLTAYVRSRFEEEWDTVDMFIFGHSHHPLNKKIEGKLFFNPGSPMDTVFAPYNSYGILEIDGKNITAKIVKINGTR